MQILSFKQQLAADNLDVFLNTMEFAELRTVIYDGERFEDVPLVLAEPEEEVRPQLATDHAEGLYQVTAKLFCALDDLGGYLPEQGQRLQINDEAGGGGFFQEYYVASSICEMGLVELELEAISE